jgi:homeobox-leucine zipper protein
MDDVSVMINESPTTKSSQIASERFLCTLGGGILCAKASMLLQNVPAALLIRFLREHRSEWADCDIDASAAAAFRSTTRNGTAGHSQLSLPLVNSSEQEEVLPPVHCTGFTFPDIECSFPACLEIAISHWT